ncbi:MAG: hypothetical protein IPK19_15130 [Chloroflexi bacterium]|nr:hypothetical protein [Chloroflexota bacterium]
MIVERLANALQPVLEISYIRRTRRNHGLEHATIHILSGRVPHLRMAGRSDSNGFVLMGEANTHQIEAAVRDALRRMRGGEHGLAVHPNCGTNLVTTGLMVSGAALFGATGATRRSFWDRLSTVFVLVVVMLLFAPSLGMEIQRTITTEGDPADLEVVSITRRETRLPFGGAALTIHRVNTTGG